MEELAASGEDETARLEDAAIFDEWRAHRSTRRRSLDRARLVMEHLQLPARSTAVPTLGIVGSKGKGTATAYASATLASQGRKVGTVMSPGILSNRDRIRVNGRSMSEADYDGMLRRIVQVKAELPEVGEDGYLSPTGSFTIFGVDHLLRSGCDTLVVEAGIGGRSDELSLFRLDALLCTRIFAEHQDLIGPTLVDIARDKINAAGPGTKLLLTIAQSRLVSDALAHEAANLGIELDTMDPHLAPPGDIELPYGYNRVNALAGFWAGQHVLLMLDHPRLDRAALTRTLESVNYPGRMTLTRDGRYATLLDAAVSRDGLVAALRYFHDAVGTEPDSVVVCIPTDKDLSGVRAELAALACEKLFVRLDTEHLHLPDPDSWPWGWIDAADLAEHVRERNTVLVGTVSFVTEVLRSRGATDKPLYVS